MMPKQLGKYLWRIFIVILYLVVSALTLFFAYGYRYDFQKSNVQKTSIVDVAGRENNVGVFLDGTQQAQVIPFQIKNVLPGKHILNVSKEGFLPWQRKLVVEEDIVSIVEDVFLVPAVVAEKTTLIKTFDSLEKVYAGEDFAAAVVPGGKELSLTTLYEKDPFKDEKIELSRSDLQDIMFFSGGDMVLLFKENDAVITNLSDGFFLEFKLPDRAHQLGLSHERQMFYFLIGDNFYAVPYGTLGKLAGSEEDFKVRGKVSAYAVGQGGNLFYISEGTIYVCDYRCKEANELGFGEEMYKNISIKAGKDYGTAVLRDISDRRYLCVPDSGSRIKCLTNRLNGQPFLNGYDQIIYGEDGGNIYFYDPRIDEKKLLLSLPGADFELVGWISDQGHFILREGNSLTLNDVNGANKYTILNDVKDITAFIMPKKALFYLKEGALYRLI
jgi:hypothetical protein